MKNKFRKLIITLLLICSSFCFLFVACNNNEDLYEKDKNFKLNYTQYTLSLFDSFNLEVKGYSNVEFTSSDDNVVSVTKDGSVYAKNYGTATVTATFNGKTDNCVVTVKNTGDVPYLKFNLLDKNISLTKNQIFSLQSAVVFNNKTYDDFALTYKSSAPTVAVVSDDGVITALNKGSCLITVQASWRGYDMKYLTENLLVSVASDVSMNVSISSDIIYTVANAIDGKTYENTFEIYCSATIDGAVVDNSNISYNFDSQKLQLDGNLFTAISKGQTQIYAIVENGDEIYTSLPVSVNILAPEIEIKETYSAKVGDSNYILEIDGLVGSRCAVKNGDTDYSSYSTFSNGKLSIYTKDIIKPRGKTQICIETDIYTYLVDVYFGTHVLDNKQDFIDFINSYGKDKTDEKTDYWYVVLANDIDLEGATLYKTWQDSFRGTFDGAGHEISNIKTKEYGIFGLISRQLKNVSFYNVVADGGNMISGYVSGTVSNVYLKGSYLSTSANGVLNFSNIALIENSVFDVTHVGSEGFVLSRVAAGTGFVKNVIALGNSKSFSNDKNDTNMVYASTDEFVEKNVGEICQENGFNSFWETDEYGAYFNGKAYVTKQPEQTLEIIYKGENFDLDLNDIVGKTPDKIYINGKQVSVPPSGKALNIVVDKYIAGHNKIIIFSDGKIIEQPFVKASHQISTAEQFIEFSSSFSGNVDADTNDSENYYAILTCDIDFSGVEKERLSKTSSDRFAGVFNGLGYSLKNISVGYWNSSTDSKQGGIFGNILGTVENLAIININCNVGWPFAWGVSGVVKNVYIQGDLSDTVETNGVLSVNSGKIENCIVNVNRTGDNSVAYGYLSNSGTIHNCYAIGNAKNFSNMAEENRIVYADVNSFYVTEKNNISTENGFSKYWKEDAFGFSFGNNIIIRYDVSSVKQIEYYALSPAGQTVTSTTKDVDLKELLGGESPKKVIVNNTAVEVSDIITLNSEDYVVGEVNSLIFGTDNKIIELPFVFVTYAISNKEEFIAFINSYSSSVSSAGWYVILTDDINMSGSGIGKTASDPFRGTFDGLGHSIQNLTNRNHTTNDAYNYGLFGHIYGTVKNVAFTGMKLYSNSYGLTTYLSGTIENVYLEGAFSEPTTNFSNSIVQLGWSGSKGTYGTIKNCIFNLSCPNVSNATLIKYDNTSVDDKHLDCVKDVYAIATAITYKVTNLTSENRTPYSSVSELLTANALNITENNGFGKYWQINENKLSFSQIEIK